MKRLALLLPLLALAAAPGVAFATAGGEPAPQTSSTLARLVSVACIALFACCIFDLATFPRRMNDRTNLARESKRLCVIGIAGFALIALQVVLFAALSPISPFSVRGGAPVSYHLRPDKPAMIVFFLCIIARKPLRFPFGKEAGTPAADAPAGAGPRRSGGFAAVACRFFEWGAAASLATAFAVSDMRRAVEPGLSFAQCFLVFVVPMLVQAVCLFGMGAAGIAAMRLHGVVAGRPLAPASARYAKGCGNVAFVAALFFGLEALRATFDFPESTVLGFLAPLVRAAFAAWLVVRFRRFARTPATPSPAASEFHAEPAEPEPRAKSAE